MLFPYSFDVSIKHFIITQGREKLTLIKGILVMEFNNLFRKNNVEYLIFRIN